MASSNNLQEMHNPSIVLYRPHNAIVEDKPIPELSDAHDTLIRIDYIGVCGSDVSIYEPMLLPCSNKSLGTFLADRDLGQDGRSLQRYRPWAHEASGTIHSIGSAVTRVKPGDRVAIEPGVPCRLCKACKSGTYHLCPDVRFAAAPGPPHDTQGTLSQILPDRRGLRI